MNYRTRVLAILFITLSLIGCGGGSKPSTPEETVVAFYSAVDKGEIGKAVSYFSEEFIALFGEKIVVGMEEQSADFEKQGGINNVEMTTEYDGEFAAVVFFRINFSNNQYMEDKVDMVVENGDWKLSPQLEK